jgi:hypothetical protein
LLAGQADDALNKALGLIARIPKADDVPATKLFERARRNGAFSIAKRRRHRVADDINPKRPTPSSGKHDAGENRDPDS